MRRRARIAFAIMVAATAQAVAAVAAPSADRSTVSAEDAPSLRAATDRIELQLGFVETGEPYLVVDLPAGGIELWRDGALLRRYAIADARIAAPRIAFVRGSSYVGPSIRRLTGLTLSPARPVERVELSANDGGPPPLPEVPPTPSEAVPAPPRYVLRFAEGVELEILADRVDVPGTVVERLADAARALGLGHGGRPRLRLALPADDAAALYRSVPDGAGAVLSLAIPD